MPTSGSNTFQKTENGTPENTGGEKEKRAGGKGDTEKTWSKHKTIPPE